MSRIGRTGGPDRHWLFDPTDIPEPIAEKLTHLVEFEGDEPPFEHLLAIVMDQILSDLPPHLEEAVRLLHLAGLSQHKAAAIIGCSHKTVKARADKGTAFLRQRIADSVWLSDLLRGQIPDESEPGSVTAERMQVVLGGLRERRAP